MVIEIILKKSYMLFHLASKNLFLKDKRGRTLRLVNNKGLV